MTFSTYRAKAIIQVANMLSLEIDEIAHDQGSVDPQYHDLLNALFNELVAELQTRGLQVSGHVRAPEFGQ